MCWIRDWAPQGVGWDGQHLGFTSRKFVFFVEKPRQNDMERCEVVLSFNVNVMCFISFRRVYMSILVKPCQLSGRCPLSPLKKKTEFRGIRLLLEIQVVAEKAKTSPKSTSNNHSSQGLLSILLVFFLSFPSSTFPKPTFKNHQPTPSPNFSK